MQQTSSSRRLWQTIKKIFLIAIFCGIFFGLFLVGNSLVRVQTILIKGDNKQQLRGLNIYYKKNIIFLSLKEMSESLLANNPELQSVSIGKKFPNSLVITIRLEPILASLEMNEGYVYLSEGGKIIQKSREKNRQLPLIHYYQKLNYSSVSAGDDIKYIDIISTLHFIRKSSNLGLKTDSVDINGLDMLLFTIGDKKLYFTTEKDIKTQDYEFEQITRQFRIEGKEFKSLDLRFEKPVIRF